MSDYPRMLYREGTADDPKSHDLHCQTIVADSAAEAAELRRDGWHLSPAEAHGKTPIQELPGDGEGALAAPLNALTAEYDILRDERDALQQEANDLRAERDELKELMAAFDRDNDGRVGGSKPKAKAG